MILVTGAAGKTGQTIIRTLARMGVATRALVYRSVYVSIVEKAGANQILVGDMRDERTVAKAMEGIRAVYHICPNVSADELVMGQIAIHAALTEGVQNFAYHSVLHPHIKAMPHHWQKMKVEETLIESSLPFTIIQPAAYMQNIMANWSTISSRGVFEVPYSIEARISMVDLDDVAEAVATFLTNEGHANAIYELAGPHSLSQIEVAESISQSLGKTVQARQIPLEKWRSQAIENGMSDFKVNSLEHMFKHYHSHGFLGNPNVLSWILESQPGSFTSFLNRVTSQV